ncbi:LysM domain-containing protein, partial [Weissella paramesenteroides]
MSKTTGSKLFKSGKFMMTAMATASLLATPILTTVNAQNAGSHNNQTIVAVDTNHAPETWVANDADTINTNMATQGISSLKQLGSYKVVWGDTLSMIAEHFNTTVAAIAKEYNIQNPDLIITGVTISDQQKVLSGIINSTTIQDSTGVLNSPIHNNVVSSSSVINSTNTPVSDASSTGSEVTASNASSTSSEAPASNASSASSEALASNASSTSSEVLASNASSTSSEAPASNASSASSEAPASNASSAS